MQASLLLTMPALGKNLRGHNLCICCKFENINGK